MPRRHTLPRIAALCAALVCLPLAAQDDARWYKVELMVFANRDAGGSEQWEPTPALAYPSTYRFLVYPDAVRALRTGHEGPSELDEFGRLTLLPPPVELPPAPDIPRVGEETGAAPDANEPAAPVAEAPTDRARRRMVRA